MARPRSCNDVFDISAMVEALRPAALAREPPWPDWQLARYGKVRRSQAPDREGLLQYRSLLDIILGFAPGCYPSHKLLREVWMELDRCHGIKGQACSSLPVGSWADSAADAIRIAMRHLLEIHRSRTTFVPMELKKLLAKVKDGRLTRSTSQLSVTTRTLARHASAASTASSVELCAISCACPKCRTTAPPLEVLSSPDSVPPSPPTPNVERSPTSVCAEENTRAVDASRGGHRKQAMMRKRPISSLGEGSVVRIVKRAKPPDRKEAYIVVHGKFMVSFTERVHKKYIELAEALAAEIRTDKVHGKDAIKLRAQELAAK
jgi:hypothetical protein